MMVVRVSKSGSLVVASLTRSQVTAMVLRMDEAVDTSSSSMLYEQESCGDSLVRMHVSKGCLIRFTGYRWAGLSMAAMSSGTVRRSGFAGPVGCREMASVALCRTTGITDAGLRPVSGQICGLGFVKDTDPVFNFADDQ